MVCTRGCVVAVVWEKTSLRVDFENAFRLDDGVSGVRRQRVKTRQSVLYLSTPTPDRQLRLGVDTIQIQSK